MKVPFLPRKHALPLSRILDAVAEDTQQSSTTVHLIISRFFEGVVDEVAAGEMVYVPGFGAFTAANVKSKYRVPRIWFSPAAAFRKQVSVECSQYVDNSAALLNYSANASRSVKGGTPAREVFRRWRARMLGGLYEKY